MTQKSIDRKLKWGIIFSLVWLAGIGSTFALFAGLKAKKEIDHSNGYLVGKGRAWFCIIFGGIGISMWLPVLFIGIFNQF